MNPITLARAVWQDQPPPLKLRRRAADLGYLFTSSTRRFCARSDSESLGATGRDRP